jgi:predicted transglutaminase-like cysteine proteinase
MLQACHERCRWTRRVNKDVKPMTDVEQYGVEDYWPIPTSGRGDCEDYALLKRQTLMRMGRPASALLMTVVRDENYQGHAVLMVRFGKGKLTSTSWHLPHAIQFRRLNVGVSSPPPED